MNKFQNILDDVKYFTKLLGHMHFAALEVNKISEETKQDFIDSQRTGHCALVVQRGLERICAQHVPGKAEEDKIRYTIVANNKVNFLLENPERKNTFPQTNEEEEQFPLKKIFGGGIWIHNVLIAVSGFHPKIDEACSIVIANQIFGSKSESNNIIDIETMSKDFKNPYALSIACGSNFIKSINFYEAIDQGQWI